MNREDRRNRIRPEQRARLKAIRESIQGGDTDFARSLIEELGGEDGNPEVAKLYFLGRTCMRENKFDEAISWFDKVLKLNPNLTAAMMQKGKALMSKQDAEGASTVFKTVLDLDPDKEAALLYLGKLDLESGKLEEAELGIRNAIALNPQHLNARLMLARVLEKRGDVEQAIKVLEELIVDYPDAAQAHHHRGAFLFRVGRLEEAKRSLEKAVELDPDRAASAFLLGNIHFKLNEFNSAEKVFLDCLEKHPQFAPALYRLAESLAALGRSGDAIKLLQQDIERRRKRSGAHGVLGKIYTAEGRYEMAKQEFLAHLHHHPQLAESNPKLVELLEDEAADVKTVAEKVSALFEEGLVRDQESENQMDAAGGKRRQFLDALRRRRFREKAVQRNQQ